MKRMPSSSNAHFANVPRADIPRSRFNRDHTLKTTFDAGLLIPVLVDEALPGDTFNLKMAAFARLATPIVPFMDNMYLDSFFFAVPMRLVWDNWQKFNGEQINPGDSTDYLIPQTTAPAGGWSVGTMSDYFGIPPLVPNITHSVLWHRAYNLIYNEWFRDQNMQQSREVLRTDGPEPFVSGRYSLQRRGRRHDYFTSALPWPQKGPSVPLPLGSKAPVYGESHVDVAYPNGHLYQHVTTPSATVVTGPLSANSGATTARTLYRGGPNTEAALGTSFATPSQYASNPTYKPPYADLSQATAATINALRQAFQLQKLYERDARGGTRYTEIIRAHFGVTSPDARLQRPEYLGGGSSPINIHPIAQTSSTDATTPQGNLAAMGTTSFTGHGFTKSFTEHTLIIGLVSARADLTYQQGLNRMFSRRTRWDFYWPALSHIGEQAILNKEIVIQGPAVVNANGPIDEQAFGYQERFAEYRYKPSLITSLFRSNVPGTLDIWHLGTNYASLPTLNNTFIQENPPVDRVIATPEEPHFLFDSHFDYKCARPMPTYSVPGLIDHF